MQTLPDMLASTVAAVPDRAFLVTPDQSMTYAEFDARTDRLATVLLDRGVTRGTPLGVLLPSGIEFALSYWAGQKIGALVAPINPMYRQREIAGVVALARLGHLITDVEHAGHLAPGDAARVQVLTWDGPAGDTLRDQIASAPPGAPRATPGFDDPACLFLTSGTTGRPKGVVQTHRNHNTTLTTMFTHFRFRYGAEKIINTMPLFNNFGATGVMGTSVFAGATMLFTSRWQPDVALDLITRHEATAILGSPTIYVDLCERLDPSRHSLASLRLAVTAGAPATEALVQRFETLAGVRPTQVYGATETTGAVAVEPSSGATKPGTVGRLVGAVTVTVVGPDGVAVAPGEVGEVVVGGDLVSPGYLHDPDATAAGFDERGWRSGDLGYLDEDDFLFLVGRQKELIISGGNNIYPAEIESLLAELPTVATCAVIGVDDARRGEVPVAVIVPRVGGSAPTEADVIAYCSEHLAAFKVPRAVHITDALPLGPTGKVLRAELRQRYQPSER